ncbi:MAG: amino acid ABC transporter substrate-binding protein [Rhodospirillales bacterium]|nr:amino acid ABC transporter substrate-binding protein [Rhodospirillales bacterium]
MASLPARLGALLAGGLALPLAGLFAAPPAANAAPPIVIGTTISETGALATDGLYEIKGIKAGVAEANLHGGWLGRKIVLKYYDDKSSPGTAVRLYQRLVTLDKVNLLVGPYSSLVTIAIAPLINKYKMATLEPGASVPSIYVPGNKWNLMNTADSTTYLHQLLPLAKQHGARTAALLGLESAYSLACYHARVAQAKQLGLKIVYRTTYTLQTDFSSIALAIKHANPDVVLECAYYPDSVNLVRALHEQGFAPKFLGETVGPVEAAYVQALGPLANRVFGNTGWWFNFKTPGNKTFIAAYTRMFHQQPDYHAAAGYTAIQVLGAAVQATHSLDQAKIRHWIVTHTVQSIQGPIHDNANGRTTGAVQDMVQIQNGVLKLVAPAELAQAPVLFPYTGH